MTTLTQEMDGMSPEAYLGFGTALIVLTAGFVAARLTLNISKTKKILIEDGKVLTSQCSPCRHETDTMSMQA